MQSGVLSNLKTWLQSRRMAYSAKARAYGLPAPKGALLVGVPGCGKSLTAKAIAAAWGVPLLRVDLGALKSKFVGEFEGNLRKAFKVIEAIGPHYSPYCRSWTAFLDLDPAAEVAVPAPEGRKSSRHQRRESLLNWNSHHAL